MFHFIANQFQVKSDLFFRHEVAVVVVVVVIWEKCCRAKRCDFVGKKKKKIVIEIFAGALS